ncbi:hypothetical protein [Neobacillus bataviensis]|uniref:hypothetical protein n=1 Tax=Neobacillus bataviensis TaxID=220685 RepID=UPI001CBBEE04|nr:hypothetical protein [Neobacillus bataviensis]
MLDKKLLIELQEYVVAHLNILIFKTESHIEGIIFSEDLQNSEIEDFIKIKRKPTFNQTLFTLIDKKGASDSEVYKKAGIDRRHFSKIRSNPEYRPGKNTTIALALALELNKKETDKLLSSAGFSLSDSETFDLVIQFCLEKKIFNIHTVNQALDYFSLKPLAGVAD